MKKLLPKAPAPESERSGSANSPYQYGYQTPAGPQYRPVPAPYTGASQLPPSASSHTSSTTTTSLRRLAPALPNVPASSSIDSAIRRDGEGLPRDAHGVWVGSDGYYYTNPKGNNTIPDPRSVYEHGRSYHGYKDGKYLLPNDGIEQDRLDVQHFAWDAYMGGALAWAPVGEPTNVLDIGTGTGIWALEFAEQHPGSRIVGTDLSQIQPWGLHPNVHWVQEDAEDEWLMYPSTFDYIHLRMTWTSFQNPKAVMKKAYEHLEPGGWLEYQDADITLQFVDPSSLGTSIGRWTYLLKTSASILGRDLEVSAKYKTWMEELGFVEVKEHVIHAPSNTWPRDPRLKEMGKWTLANTLQGLEGLSMRIMHNGLHLATEEIQKLVTEVKEDIKDRKHRFNWTFRVVYGRKPPSSAMWN